MNRRSALKLLGGLAAALGGAAYVVFAPGETKERKARGLPSAAAGPSRQSPQAGLGAWVDEVVFREEADKAKAINMFEADEIQVYGLGISDPELYRRIQASRVIRYETSYGSSSELAFNPVGPTFPRTGELNPFHVPAIREAMNWLIDREYIVDEIYGGLAVPRYLPLTTAFPDYARLADVARRLELYYAPNPDKAKAVIGREMVKLGAKLVNGRWHYRDKPVRIIFIIRTEDLRREIGDYVSTLLESAGFTVDRQYKTAAESSPIWIGSNPADGRWHIYTGGWVSLAIDRDQADMFNAYYTPRGRPDPLWQAYTPSPRLDKIAEILDSRRYTTWAERNELMAEALKLSLQDSVRVWLADVVYIWPRRREVVLAADLAGGIAGSALWPYTIRYAEGGRRRVNFASPGMLTEPWNPIAGSNWIFDNIIIRATQDAAAFPDPFTGLFWPQRIKAAEVYVQKGLPCVRTHDWVALKFVPSIEVPRDAWIDWDAAAEKFVTVGQAHPRGLKARTRTVIHYADELWQTSWHDGSRLSFADFLFSLIVSFDRAKPQSAIFDESAVPLFKTFMSHFRGARVLRQNPLAVEIYSDQLFPDAETIAASRAGVFYSSVPWHELALGVMAEKNRELAFSASKADRLKVEWMSYIGGPSLAVLDRHLAAALREPVIPYAAAMAEHASRREARERYEKLQAWRRSRGHFWVSNGPFYLHAIYPVEKIVVVRKAPQFGDASGKWLRFVEPRIADVEVNGPRMVETGAAAEFEIKVTFGGRPYPSEDIEFVRFLVFDSRGELVDAADAGRAGDGLWQVKLGADQTARLGSGANRLEAVVTSKVVAVPSQKTFWFVTVDSGAKIQKAQRSVERVAPDEKGSRR
ncbi:MAG TPA: ABC transporter substrate-binding protein [Candidatus Acidoferrales bacterium]|nr:ABC transporter substrate-binding protein [Candidatus Acidoferrales bacterium]